MPLETDPKLRRIERASRVLSRCCSAALYLFTFTFVCAAACFLFGRGQVSFEDTRLTPASLPLGSRLGLLALLALTYAVLVKGVLHLRSLLRGYGRGEVFTLASALEVRRIGITCILWCFIKFGWAVAPHFLYGLATTKSIFEIDAMVVGGVLIVISWFAEAAAHLREENELTI